MRRVVFAVAILILLSACENCANLPAEEQGACCAKENKNEAICTGEWKILDGKCAFACRTFEDDGKYDLTYSEGILRYSINVEKPTPCHKVETRKASSPGQVILDLRFVSDGGICTQVITPQTISGEVKTDNPGTVKIYVQETLVYQKVFN